MRWTTSLGTRKRSRMTDDTGTITSTPRWTSPPDSGARPRARPRLTRWTFGHAAVTRGFGSATPRNPTRRVKKRRKTPPAAGDERKRLWTSGTRSPRSATPRRRRCEVWALTRARRRGAEPTSPRWEARASRGATCSWTTSRARSRTSGARTSTPRTRGARRRRGGGGQRRRRRRGPRRRRRRRWRRRRRRRRGRRGPRRRRRQRRLLARRRRRRGRRPRQSAARRRRRRRRRSARRRRRRRCDLPQPRWAGRG